MAKEKKSGFFGKAAGVIGIILCIVFAVMLVFNLTIIIKGTINPDRPPSVLGVTPMVVLSGSMSGDAPDHIEIGDLVITVPVDPADLKVGDVITYIDEGMVVTHRIIDLLEAEDGTTLFQTKGDANESQDARPIAPDQVIGKFKHRIPKLGDFAFFLQTPTGMVIFIGIPLFAFIIYDIIRRNRAKNKEDKKTAELQAEIERLKAMAGEAEKAEEPESVETPAPEITD